MAEKGVKTGIGQQGRKGQEESEAATWQKDTEPLF